MEPSWTVLYRGGVISSPADPRATAMLVTGDRISWLGTDADAPAAGVTVELAGALVTPAFVDAHVHATDTGIALLGLDLGGTRSAEEVLAAVERRAEQLPDGAVVLGHGWDESGWARQVPPTAAELDRAGGGRAVYLSRACVHSALVSTPLLSAQVRAAPGFAVSGWLSRQAHHLVRDVAMSSITLAQQRAGQVAALRAAAALGIAAVHECGGPWTSSEDDFTALLALSRVGDVPEVSGYWGELGAAAKARELGALGAGGDLFADGSLGTRTAQLRQPYLDIPSSSDAGGSFGAGSDAGGSFGAGSDAGGGCGFGYITTEQVADHLVGCARHGVQGGFHAIGDAAISTVLAGFAGAAAVVGQDRLRAGRHRIEHLEILDKALIAALVDFGVVASVQPAFDRLWGGEKGMYAQRLGVARSLAANPIGSLAGVGVPLAFGSDSPVTPFDPWGTVRAAMRHHNPVQRISAKAAFAAHSRGGWRAAGQDGDGVLLPGWPATFAVWSTPGGLAGRLPALVADGADPEAVDPPLPVCQRTVLRGRTIYEG